MPRLILFNKPYGVLCEFSLDGSRKPMLAKTYLLPVEGVPSELA